MQTSTFAPLDQQASSSDSGNQALVVDLDRARPDAQEFDGGAHRPRGQRLDQHRRVARRHRPQHRNQRAGAAIGGQHGEIVGRRLDIRVPGREGGAFGRVRPLAPARQQRREGAVAEVAVQARRQLGIAEADHGSVRGEVDRPLIGVCFRAFGPEHALGRCNRRLAVGDEGPPPHLAGDQAAAFGLAVGAGDGPDRQPQPPRQRALRRQLVADAELAAPNGVVDRVGDGEIAWARMGLDVRKPVVHVPPTPRWHGGV